MTEMLEIQVKEQEAIIKLLLQTIEQKSKLIDNLVDMYEDRTKLAQAQLGDQAELSVEIVAMR